MGKKLSLIILLLACACVCVYAQEVSKHPDLATADGDIFDPTRKEKKEGEAYVFGMGYRMELGYIQNWQWSRGENFGDLYLHGGRLGATFDFLLPIRFSMQTGLLFDIAYGRNTQHWRSLDAPSVQEEYIRHQILQVNMTIPVRVYYTVPLWKKLNMFFCTGPQFVIGMTEHDYLQPHLSEKARVWLENQGVMTSEYDRLKNEVGRFAIQWSIGGGFEWDKYRLQAGYAFGLNNMVRKKVIDNQHMWQWGWYVTFCYRFN